MAVHLKPYTRDEFIEIAVNVLNRDKELRKTWLRFISELVFDELSSNIRECIRIARLTDNNIAKAQQVVNMLITYG